ncbi:MAG: ROK family protein [Planctomycetaceae bacterium]
MPPGEYYIGVDIGGTSAKVGVVSADGRVHAQRSESLPYTQGRDASMQAMFECIETCLRDSGLTLKQIAGIGVAAPGTMDLAKGIIFHPFNLPGWENLPLRHLLADRFGLPTVLQNDANAAAYGESWIGGGADARSLMFWTLGTGVGGGIVLNGEVLSGAHFHGGECGHMIIQMEGGPRSEFGIHGSLELYCGAKALVRRCNDGLTSGVRSSLGNLGREITPVDIASHAIDGDPFAHRLVMQTARYLGIGTVNIMHILNPEVVLIGGAMTFGQYETELGRQFLEEVRRTVKEIAFPIPAERTRIDFAKLGNDAGFIGAAGCVKQALESIRPPATHESTN